MEPDRGLPRPGAALDHERAVGRVRDQPVLVGLDRGDDVPHPLVPAPLELLEQEVADAGAVERRAVERLVRDVEERPPARPEPTAEGHALWIDRRRRVERTSRGRLPVHDETVAALVVHPAPPDVERGLERLEVEPAEAEPALGVVVRREPARGPRVERRLGDLAVRGVGRANDDVPHVLEALVRVVDVRLLRRKLRVRHVFEGNGRSAPRLSRRYVAQRKNVRRLPSRSSVANSRVPKSVSSTPSFETGCSTSA